MSVSREDQGNQSSGAPTEQLVQDQLIEVGEVSKKTKGGPAGAAPDIGAGYLYG
jgi:hypothetical protein